MARRRCLHALVLVALLLVGCGTEEPPVQRSAAPPPPPSASPAGVEEDAPGPDRIRIPAIGVDADVIDLGLKPDGALETPDEDFDQAGWWSGGSAPGEAGPTVIVGHVDDHTGPAVFFKLRELGEGDEVIVERDDGSTVSYIVTGSEKAPKDDFPTDRVYGDTSSPELRLVTCGGTFDRENKTYLDNVIVYGRSA